MSNILLINHYASTPATGMGGRLHYLARELARLGHDVTVVGARKHHLLRDGLDTDALPAEEEVDGYRLLRIDVPGYTHAHDKRRVLAWFAFAARLPGLRRRLGARPDAVLYSSPQLLGYLGAERLARAYGARLVFDVRDIWPWTLIEIGSFSERHPFIKFLQWIEDRAYENSDFVVANQPGVGEHMKSRLFDPQKFLWLPNGVSLTDVKNREPLAEEIEEEFHGSDFAVVYAGSLGKANAMWVVVEAAKYLPQSVKIIIVGRGALKEEIENRIQELGLVNIRVFGGIPKNQVFTLYEKADALFLSWNKSDLYKWGMSTNKTPEYFAAGKPIIQCYSGGNDPVAKFDAGLTVPAEDPQALADAIRRLRDMPEAERRRMGENGRRAALEHYDYAKLARRLEQVLLD